MRSITLGELDGRNNFGRFLTSRGLIGHAVEIGTHRGDYAEILLSNWPGRLSCVDPWAVPPGYELQAQTLWGGGNRQDDFLETQNKLHKFGERYSLLRLTSEEAVSKFPKHSLDFVYLDGDHRYEKVIHDLKAWWTRLRTGGILAGHDFIMPGEVNGGWESEIQPAVFEFAISANVIIHLVPEHGLPWSYYLIK